jgi:LysR family positive regulator for ilvC
MDYDTLRLFLHLSRSLHFGRTSRECHISPSALSRAVQRLEAEVGHALFERDQRSVTLTPEGEVFRSHAAETLARWHSVQQELSGVGPRLSGTISIFASVTACQSFLPRILANFRRLYPGIHIKLETGYAADALAMLEQGSVDVAVAALPDRIPSALEARIVVYTPLVFVAPASECQVSERVEQKPIPWSEVPIVLPLSGLARASVDRWFKRRRITPNIYGEVAGNEAILSLVSLGCGVGIVPKLVMDKSPLRAEVRQLDVEPRLEQLRVGVCTQQRKLKHTTVRAFWDSLDVAET